MVMRIIFIFTILIVTSLAHAELNLKENCLKKISTFKNEQKTFTQEKIIKGLSKPVKSSGKVSVTEDKIEWMTEEPFESKVVVTADGFIIENKENLTEETESEKFDSSYFKEFGQILLKVHEVNYTTERKIFLEKKFDVSCEVELDEKIKLVLLPKHDNLGKIIKSISILFYKKTKSIELEDSRGDITRINLL
jgi:hypothetical protein